MLSIEKNLMLLEEKLELLRLMVVGEDDALRFVPPSRGDGDDK